MTLFFSIWVKKKSDLSGLCFRSQVGRRRCQFPTHRIVGGILVWGTRQWATALSLQVRAQFTSLRGCFVSISHKWTLKRHEASLNPMSLVCAGSCHCILQFCCQWKWEIDPRPATKPPSCWHFNCFIPGGSQLCGCECLIHQTLQASHFQWAETPKSTTCNRSESRKACRDDVF